MKMLWLCDNKIPLKIGRLWKNTVMEVEQKRIGSEMQFKENDEKWKDTVVEMDWKRIEREIQFKENNEKWKDTVAQKF